MRLGLRLTLTRHPGAQQTVKSKRISLRKVDARDNAVDALMKPLSGMLEPETVEPVSFRFTPEQLVRLGRT